MENRLVLNILSPEETLPAIECDSIHLVISDDEKGKGGGSYGIRPGHINSLISMDEGDVTAIFQGEKVCCAKVSSGLAIVENDVVTIMSDKILHIY